MDNDFDFNPTDEDILAEQDDDLLDTYTDEDDWTWDDDYSPRDERYDTVSSNGMPSWSLFA